jgi:hypothetical protein
MNTDRVFVLLLVVLLPLSGCFDGGSVGDADADDGTSEDNTGEHNENELFTSFATIIPVNEQCYNDNICIWEYVLSINTTISQALQIVSSSTQVDGNYFESEDDSTRNRTSYGQLNVISNCDSGQVWNRSAAGYIPTVGDECQHDFFIYDVHSNEDSSSVITKAQISLTWRIDEVTVI